MGEPPPLAKVYYDGCPGCAMDSKKESRKGVPYKELLFVAITTIASGRCMVTHLSSTSTLRALARAYVFCNCIYVIFGKKEE